MAGKAKEEAGREGGGGVKLEVLQGAGEGGGGKGGVRG